MSTSEQDKGFIEISGVGDTGLLRYHGADLGFCQVVYQIGGYAGGYIVVRAQYRRVANTRGQERGHLTTYYLMRLRVVDFVKWADVIEYVTPGKQWRRHLDRLIARANDLARG